MDEYIKRKDAFDILQSRLDNISQMSYLDMDWHELDIMRNAIENAIDDIGEVPPSDVQPVNEHINKSTDLQPVNQWISCKDKMPEPEKDVLIWYRYTWGAGFTSYRFGISRWFSNIKRWYEGYLPKDIEVLYWQSLPKPPKDGDVE